MVRQTSARHLILPDPDTVIGCTQKESSKAYTFMMCKKAREERKSQLEIRLRWRRYVSIIDIMYLNFHKMNKTIVSSLWSQIHSPDCAKVLTNCLIEKKIFLWTSKYKTISAENLQDEQKNRAIFATLFEWVSWVKTFILYNKLKLGFFNQ